MKQPIKHGQRQAATEILVLASSGERLSLIAREASISNPHGQ
jgi:hypothetical protein